MDERIRRQWAATEAQAFGWGGVSAVSSAIGMSRKTIRKGLAELDVRRKNPRAALTARLRSPGGGRKRLTESDPDLSAALEWLIDPTTRGDPMSPLRWTCKSTHELAQALTAQGHALSPRTVGRLLNAAGYSLQGNRKTKEGADHPDRNAQFEHINATVSAALADEQPVISVDTKKKELIGPFRNAGREWLPQGEPEQVRVHDFIDAELGRANPYGVYDIGADEGWVSVGTDHDTAAFAVQTIRRWWYTMGRPRYPKARELTITADGGGSNGSRVRLWKLELSRLASETGLSIRVCHFPPGTSKWNKIEHRLFSFITMNWRGRPLISHEVIVQLIANTRTKRGLKVHAEIDANVYPMGMVVSDAEFDNIPLDRAEFHGDWNYVIRPK